MKEQKIVTAKWNVRILPTASDGLKWFENLVTPSMLKGWEVKQISTTSCKDNDLIDGTETNVVVYTLLMEREVKE